MSARSELTRAARLHEAAARATQRAIQLNEEHIAHVEQQQAKQAGA